MKTLTSSCCSKTIFDKKRDKGFSCFKDLCLNRAEICSLPSNNHVRIRFLHLLSVQQHRSLQPVFSTSSLSSDTQQVKYLETTKAQLEEQIRNSETTWEEKSGFEPGLLLQSHEQQKKCSFGEHFFMVGNHPMFGLWDPESAIPLTWTEGHVWILELDLPVGESIQYKFILKTRTGNLLWQPGPDRIFKSWDTENTIVVSEDWQDAGNQKVMEEQPLAIDSEMAFVAKNSKTRKELVSDTSGAPPLEKPLAIVAENISYSTEEFIANSNNEVFGVRRSNFANDEALDVANKSVLKANEVGNTGREEMVQNPTFADVEGGLLMDEGCPVLVPGLIPLTTVSSKEEMLDEDEKNSTIISSNGNDEAKHQKMPELDEKQELENEAKEETINAISKKWEEQLDKQQIEKPQVVIEERPDFEPFTSNVFESDIQWFHKLLNNLGFQ